MCLRRSTDQDIALRTLGWGFDSLRGHHTLEVVMSRYQHNDLTGETVAKMWHQIAGVISLAAVVSGVGIVVTAGAGYFWHRWAVGQHQIEIERLQGELLCRPKEEQRV